MYSPDFEAYKTDDPRPDNQVEKTSCTAQNGCASNGSLVFSGGRNVDAESSLFDFLYCKAFDGREDDKVLGTW